VYVEELKARSGADEALLIDVRTKQEFQAGAISGATNIPVEELRSRLAELPRDRDIIVYCQVGQRGYLATRILKQAGFSVANLSGGYKAYRLHHPRIVNERIF
jgi:rhodanese-related sulfurtransferase